MSFIKNTFKTGSFMMATAIMFVTACNKEPEQILGPTPPVPTGLSLGETLAARPTDSLYYRMVVRSGLLPTISNKANTYTIFVADNVAMRQFVNAASGGAIPVGAPDAVHSNFISTMLPAASAAGIVGYNITPQSLMTSAIPATFPNQQLPSILNPAPTVSAFLRLTIFPSTRNGAWLNNGPLGAPLNLVTANGIIHHTAIVITPPSRFLWNRIDTDAGLTYLKAAIIRADSGTAAPGTLQGALLNIGANLTVFAPTDAAFQATLTGAIARGLIAMGVPPATALAQATALAASPTVFTNPALYGVLSAQTVKGIVVYHILGNRAFTNNFPTVTTSYPTLLNGAIATHPGVALTAVFGTPFVSSATVKGIGNATASNLIINTVPLTPDPNGTSDQHYLNGVLHKINQVLLPQ